VFEHVPVLQMSCVHSIPSAQLSHAAPPPPQDAALWLAKGMQKFPLQQPAGQLDASHVQVPVAPHLCPGPHAAQTAPPVPHAVAVWLANGTHVVPLQHPAGQLAGVHAQTPNELHV